ncbi:dynamin associated protein [Echinococcus multilocularis]|uniref:Dynamin associated protein n=1 Tax=Echinococcus multilocularis TaxID=6211 RepID=A0A087VWC9_ECHMU|nr:dynamin associated protein [Echinococcus multilocularis]
MGSSITVSFSLAENVASPGDEEANPSLESINVGPEVDPEYAVWFQLTFWFVVVFASVVWVVCCWLWNMDPGRDGIIYRLSVGKPKSE